MSLRDGKAVFSPIMLNAQYHTSTHPTQANVPLIINVNNEAKR